MRHIIFLLVCITATFVCAADDYRNFMDTQGRAIRAKILSYDAQTKKIRLERDNGNTATVPVSIFSEADQEFIKTWLKFEGVRSSSKFKLAFERRSLKSWKHERIGRINYSDGSHEDNQVVGKTDFDEYAYEIEVINRNKYALKGLKLEYCIFYDQEVSQGAKKPERGILHGVLDLEDIPAQSKKTYNTKSVIVYKDESNAEFISSGAIRGEILGISAKVYAAEDGHSEILRYEGQPKTVVKEMAWSDSSNIIQIPKYEDK